MTIEETLNEKFREALKKKDGRTLDVIRMIRSEVQKVKTSEGFSGKVDDSLWREVIARYSRKMQKAIAEYKKAGESGREMIEKLKFEIEFLKPFLPQLLSSQDTEKVVRDAIEKVSANSPKMAGRVVGEVMKQYKGRVDPACVKQIAEKLLGG